MLNTRWSITATSCPGATWRAARLPLVRAAGGRARDFSIWASWNAPWTRITYSKEHGRKRIRLVAVSGASNVLGSFNDLGAICQIAHQYGAQFLVDGAQLVAHRRVDLARDEIDYLAFSGHKVYAPFGSGALVARRALLTLEPLCPLCDPRLGRGKRGRDRRAGQGDVAAAADRDGRGRSGRAGADAARAARAWPRIPGHPGLLGIRDPDAPLLRRPRAPVIVFESATTPRNLVAKELGERAGIGVRDGCFCAHIVVRDLIHIHPIRTWIGALGLHLAPEFFRMILPGVVRVSLGLENDERDVDALLEALAEISRARRARGPTGSSRRRIMEPGCCRGRAWKTRSRPMRRIVSSGCIRRVSGGLLLR